MKKNIFLAIISLTILSIVFVQCIKENINKLENNQAFDQKIEMRSQAPDNVVYPPIDCGNDNFDGIKCGTTDTVSQTVITDAGCEMEVTMNITTCIDETNRIFTFDFSNLHYHFIYPVSSSCADYYLGTLWVKTIGEINDELDDFEDELADKFQDQWMKNWVVQENADCDHRYGRSRYFKATCVQRCLTPPSDVDGAPFISRIKPCATDGCCVDIAHYCLIEGKGEKVYENTITISPCTDFFTVDCGNLYPYGDCRDKGCSN